jgi:plasmid stabilization system protein ParE
MAEVVFHADAEAEYQSALAWYQARSVRAAARFEAAVEQAVAEVAANPGQYPKCDERHHFRLLRRYPYSLIYRVDREQVRVVAVAHSRRLPGYWSGRA